MRWGMRDEHFNCPSGGFALPGSWSLFIPSFFNHVGKGWTKVAQNMRNISFLGWQPLENGEWEGVIATMFYITKPSFCLIYPCWKSLNHRETHRPSAYMGVILLDGHLRRWEIGSPASRKYVTIIYGTGSAATLPQGQLRPYPCQGSAATLPTKILWKGQRFLPLPGVSCDPTWPQCKESYRFLHYFKVWRFYGLRFLVVCLSFLSLGSWQPMLSMIQVQVQHYFYQNFPRPLGNPCFQWFRSKYNILSIKNIPFIKILPPLGRLCFQVQHFFTKTFLLSKFPPPPPPRVGSPCFQVQHSFDQKHSFYQNFTTPPWQPMLSSTTFLYQKHSFYQNFTPPPFGSPCFQVQHSFYQKHSLYQIFSPPLLAAHAFNDSSYQGSAATLPDLSVKNPPGFHTISRFDGFMVYGFLPTQAFNDSGSSTTFLLSKTFLISKCFPPPLGSPCFQWFRLPGVICAPTWPQSRGQPMLSMIQVNRVICDPTWPQSRGQPMLSSTGTASNLSTPRQTPGKLSRDPTHLLFPIKNSEQR